MSQRWVILVPPAVALFFWLTGGPRWAVTVSVAASAVTGGAMVASKVLRKRIWAPVR